MMRAAREQKRSRMTHNISVTWRQVHFHLARVLKEQQDQSDGIERVVWKRRFCCVKHRIVLPPLPS
jgi:hypothetical protein